MIESEEEYEKAEARLELMKGANPRTVEAKELKRLTKAIVAYLKKKSKPVPRIK